MNLIQRYLLMKDALRNADNLRKFSRFDEAVVFERAAKSLMEEHDSKLKGK